MKLDILKEFKEFLYEIFDRNTANRYYYAIVKLFKNKQFNDISEIELEFLTEEMSKLKTKTEFSLAKNGLKQLKQAFPNLNIPDDEFLKSQSLKKRNWSKKPKATLYYDSIKRKINSLGNEKYKYAFRLMLASGLRVSEVAALTKSDITISGNKISVMVLKGKGGSNGLVDCLPDKYLCKNLPRYMENKRCDEPLFYKADSMKKKAASLGIECHDLRRIAAIKHRSSNIKEIGAYESNKEVQAFLRHERFSTTKRYIFNKKLKIKQIKTDIKK